MAIGLVGRKSGMTRVFTEDGVSVPVTVVAVFYTHRTLPTIYSVCISVVPVV